MRELRARLDKRSKDESQQKAALRESEKKFKDFYDHAPDMFVSVDANTTKILQCNPKLVSMLGYSKEEIIGRTIFDIYHPNCMGDVKNTFRRFVESGTIHDVELQLQRKDGSIIDVSLSVSAVRDKQGKILYSRSVLRDITERKRIQESLRLSQQELSIKNQIAQIFLTIPDDEVYSEVLQVVLKALESRYGVFGFIDEHGSLIVPTMTRDIWDKCQVPEKAIIFPQKDWGDSNWPVAIREKRIIYLNEPSLNVPEGHIPIRRHISLPILYQGEAIGLFQVANKKVDYNEKDIRLLESIANRVAPILNIKLQRDREEKKRIEAEEKIKNQNILLEEAVQDKQIEMEHLMERLIRQERLAAIGQISGSIAHELRNPLGAIKQSIFYLNRLHKNGKLASSSSKVQEHLELLSNEIDTSDKVISDLLQMTKVEPLKKEQTNLQTIISEAVERCHINDEIQIMTELIPEQLLIWADPLQMRQVFINLLNNATQAISQNGVVKINAKMLNKDNGFLVAIHDNGCGISSKNLSKVFEPLFTTKAKGTGLGLSICKHIIENHDGSIKLSSQVNQGTTVIIELPFENKIKNEISNIKKY